MGLTRIAILAVALISPAAVAPAAPPDGPVVIFLVDTLRPDRMSAYGAPRATTPAADALAREATVFDHAYALSSWTRASVGTLFTSLLPAASGALDRNGKLDPAVPTLPQLFHDRGWKTAAFVGNANITAQTGFSRGFDVFDSVDATEPGFEGHPRARVIVDPAVRFVQGQKSPRFLLYVHVLDPHLPFNLDATSSARFAAGAGRRPNEPEALFLDYDRAVRQADDQFARLVAALRAKGFWERATVLYTSDHGEEFYEHGGRGHGDSLHEEQVRVPLILKLPGGTARVERAHDLVSLADVAPTLAEIYGLPRHAAWIGASLLAPPPGRLLYFTEDLDGDRLYAARQGTKKVVARLYPRLEARLYDLARDPGEKAGGEIACGTQPAFGTGELMAALETWRARDVSAFSRIDFEKTGAEAVRFVLTMALPSDLQPFLTLNEACRYESSIRGSAFTLQGDIHAGESFRLSIAADERGEIPPHRLTVFDHAGNVVTGARRDALLRSVRVERPVMPDTESEEDANKLRNLGYLGGATQAKKKP